MRGLRFSIFLAGVAGVVTSGCGGSSAGVFTATFPDNRPEQLEPVLTRLAEAAPRHAPAIVVGVSAKPAHVVVLDLETGTRLWERQPDDIQQPALLAGDSVITHEGHAVVGRDAKSGSELFRIDDDGMTLIGADGEEGVGALVLTRTGGVEAESRIVITGGGAIRKQLDVNHAVGAPAVRAGMIFLPWDTQNLSVLDGKSGEEIARVRLQDAVASGAFVSGRDVYFGESGVFRLSQSTLAGTKAGAEFFTPNTGVLPGAPRFMIEGDKNAANLGGARNSVRLAWRPVPAGNGVGLTDDNLYLVYYRAVFGLAHGERKARWAYTHGVDIIGTAAVAGGLLVADRNGDVVMLDAASGATRWSKPLGRTLSAATFGGGAPTSGSAGQAAEGSSGDQLAALANLADARLVAGQSLAVELLAQTQSDEVTGHLVTLCQNPRLAKQVRERACSSLSERTAGADDVMLALTRHASFLEGTDAPPAGSLGMAAVRMKLKDAVPLLLAHLKDPHTQSTDLPRLMAALKAFGDRSAIAPIRDFVRLYHADEWDTDTAKALVLGVQALADLEGPAARPMLEELANDEMGLSEVREEASKVIAKLDAEPQPAAAKGKGTKRKR